MTLRQPQATWSPTGPRSADPRQSADERSARRETIALSHQIIDLALNGPARQVTGRNAPGEVGSAL